MADRLTLRPVAKIVQADHAERPGHADQRAEINANPFQPERAIEALVDQLAMHADGVTEAERDAAGHNEKCEAPQVKVKGPAISAASVMPPIQIDSPAPSDFAVDRIGALVREHAFGAQDELH